jgi:hypothetical protein
VVGRAGPRPRDHGLLGLSNKRFGVVGGVIDLVDGSREGRGLRSWRVLLLVGIISRRARRRAAAAAAGTAPRTNAAGGGNAGNAVPAGDVL